jgi:hypothetical protein
MMIRKPLIMSQLLPQASNNINDDDAAIVVAAESTGRTCEHEIGEVARRVTVG